METAKDWKDKGNALVKEKKYKEALDCYSKAIEIDPNDPILYSNRSAMHLNLSEFDQALADADKAISIKADYAKAYSVIITNIKHSNKIFKNMKRKDYQKPTMDIVKLQQTQTLLAGSGEPSMRNSIDGWGNGGEDNEELTI